VYFRSLAECSLAAYSFTSFFNSFVSSDKHTTHTTHARHHQLENHIGHTQITERERYREKEKERKICRFVAVTLLFLLPCLPPRE
jgi:hypothetical protein